MEKRRHWRHNAITTFSKDKVRIQCSCGWQSPLRPVGETREILDLHTVHTGLIERGNRIQ